MTKKGSALMQVLVVGLIVAAFSVLMLRYAVTRSANISRTERILESQIIADSCLDQYMDAYASSLLYGSETYTMSQFPCQHYDTGNSNNLSANPIYITATEDITSTTTDEVAVRFTIEIP